MTLYDPFIEPSWSPTTRAVFDLYEIAKRVAFGYDAGEPLPAILKSLIELEPARQEALHQVVRTARTQGHSWREIGDSLGISRQAAQQRFGTSS